jgi:hypothetical protein
VDKVPTISENSLQRLVTITFYQHPLYDAGLVLDVFHALVSDGSGTNKT